MKPREQFVSMGKIHHSVQEMLAEARQIVRPSQPQKASNTSQFDINFPSTKINQHLKQILREPIDTYKKIQRQKRYLSVNLQDYNEITQKQQTRQPHSSSQFPSYQDAKSSNRYDLRTIIIRVEDQLLDKRNKRKLCNKKTLNLLPELPEIQLKPQFKQNQRRYHRTRGKKHSRGSKNYFTIVQNQNVNQNVKKVGDQVQLKTFQLEKINNKAKLLNQYRRKAKKVKSQLLRTLEDKPDSLAKSIERKKQNKVDKDSELGQVYEPWEVQNMKEMDFFDINNL